ncbi:hypothetical protein O0I10_001444 [Lichtheimia ornata]|uniref:Small RNA 2'-O-methyltransferase n=1 Tax=Lichtheimia ornata TaxID=688661 RepID=A0AAD7VAN3_9FUNG|nr:uncharacterized protein O0I10_001444 [Lichtheimia ornata]KAJ8662484.1 hypothetical protein O0I10_001444 [Lichtheimia ornata]
MVTMEEDHYTTFSPPLWRQRRTFILDILRQHNVSSVLDYGCGEGSVLSFLIPPTLNITRLAGLDICMDSLKEAVERCQPWPADYSQLREYPLTIDVYQGSVDEYDKRLAGFDAIICSEVIEHLYAPVLDRILNTALGQYHPRIFIVTTPNAEYNVHFEQLNYGQPNAVFRHDDHKFEWTRQEFQTWCKKGAQQHNYDVSFHGIGLVDGKKDDVSLGHCTQACVFVRRDSSVAMDPINNNVPHRHVKRIDFPYYNEPPLSNHEALEVIEGYIATLCQVDVDIPSLPQQQHPPAVLEWCLDWSDISQPSSSSNDDDIPTSNKDNPPQQQPTPPYDQQYTRTPQRFPIEILWDILHIRQICKSMARLKELLTECSSAYQIDKEDLIVCKSFPVIRDDNVYSTTSEDDNDL